MDHAITVWDVVLASGAVLGVVLLAAGLFLLLDLMNPFRSGH